MPILKNEPVYDPEKDYPGGDCYMKPRHIIVEGTQKEMGYELAKMARRDYGVKALAKYTNGTYGEAHRAYMERNFPSMARCAEGVREAFGLPADDVEHDATQIPYDFTDIPAGTDVAGGDTPFNFCSFVCLPRERSGGGVLTSRNLDLFAIPLWKGFFDLPREEGEYDCFARSLVLEKRPTDGGYKSILVGGMEMLNPWIDGMNEKGLYFTLLSDPYAVGKEASPPAGAEMSGISYLILGPMLLEKCATVKEAKKEILMNRVLYRFLTAHMVLVDATGDACTFEIDAATQHYVFTDRKPNEPLFCTNHPTHVYPDPSKFPKVDKKAEHNTFNRIIMLRDFYDNKSKEAFTNKGAGPLTKEDAIAMTDYVHCAFVDDKVAEAGKKERTLLNTTADLSKREFYIKFYVRDVGAVPGTNHMKDLMTKRYTFGF